MCIYYKKYIYFYLKLAGYEMNEYWHQIGWTLYWGRNCLIWYAPSSFNFTHQHFITVPITTHTHINGALSIYWENIYNKLSSHIYIYRFDLLASIISFIIWYNITIHVKSEMVCGGMHIWEIVIIEVKESKTTSII